MHQRAVNNVGVQMTENHASGLTESKFMRVFLILIGALLIFAGPTYVSYILEVIGLNYIASVAIGIALFAVGILMIVYLAKKKVVT
jgi:uncharacterized membrane protein HdeD (DUF308 family)